MFAQMRKITGKFTQRMGSLKNKNGDTESLYSVDIRVKTEEGTETTVYEKEPNILLAEVEWAIEQLKDNKAPGADGIPIELIKAAGDGMVKEITTLCNLIWEKEEWPKDWEKSIFIPIFKKGDPRECENYMRIAIISHTSKILLKIIHKRMESTIERELPMNQAGFRKRRGTRDHIANLRWIMERQREFGQEVHLCFIDYNKAFDCINHALMWKTLSEMGIPMHLIVLLSNLYGNQVAMIKTEHGETASFQIRKGVRQGCILSPYLFNLYAERIMRKAGLDETGEGVRIAGRTLNNLRYADDTTLLAGKKEGLKDIIRKLKIESEKAGLYFNIKKTKIMTTENWKSFEVDGEVIEVVTSFSFLGAMIVREGGCDGEIRRRITLGRMAMQGMEKIWKDKHVSIMTKTRIVKAMIFPVVLYGCETWTKTKAMEKKIDACEMWIWRRMLRVSWTEKRTNVSILQEIGQLRGNLTLGQRAARQKLMFFGHVMRSDGLEKEMMLACGEGERRRGRPRKRWMEEIHEKMKMNLEELREATRDRDTWRRTIKAVARIPRIKGTR